MQKEEIQMAPLKQPTIKWQNKENQYNPKNMNQTKFQTIKTKKRQHPTASNNKLYEHISTKSSR